MLYRFRVISDEEEDFLRDIDIRSDQTFLDLHKIIQESAGYDSSQIASFFITDDNWEKGEEIPLLNMTGDDSAGITVMEKAVISEYISKEKEKLLYVFDYFSGRAFFISLSKIIKEDKNKKYPCCSRSVGKPPPQIVLGDLNINDIFDEELNKIFGEEDDGDNDKSDPHENIDDYKDLL